MRIHDSVLDETVVPTPDNWPEIRISGIQIEFSLDDKVPVEKLQYLLAVSIDEIVSDYDPNIISLPLDDAQQIYFRLAVYQLAFSKLIPELPVNNQHKSDPEDLAQIRERMKFYRELSISNRKKIPGYQYKSENQQINSELICAD